MSPAAGEVLRKRPRESASERRERASGAERAAQRRASDAVGESEGRSPSDKDEQRGAIRGSWGTTENNRKARFYDLTAAGRKLLAEEKREWDRTVAIMQALLGDQS